MRKATLSHSLLLQTAWEHCMAGICVAAVTSAGGIAGPWWQINFQGLPLEARSWAQPVHGRGGMWWLKPRAHLVPFRAHCSSSPAINAGNPPAASRGSGTEPWYISQASHGKTVGWAPRKSCGAQHACSVPWSCPFLQELLEHISPARKQLQALCCLGRQFGAGNGWTHRTLGKGPHCTKLLLWGLLLGVKVDAEQGVEADGWKLLHKMGRISYWAAVDRPGQCYPHWGVTVTQSEPECLCTNGPHKYFFFL